MISDEAMPGEVTMTPTDGAVVAFYEAVTAEDVSRFRMLHTSPGTGACWQWVGICSTGAYGRFRLGSGVSVSAHRFALAVATGGDLPGPVLHSCDNPQCVNPGHLRVGTARDNATDHVQRNMGRRRRMTVAEKALLTAVYEIWGEGADDRMRAICGKTVAAVWDSAGKARVERLAWVREVVRLEKAIKGQSTHDSNPMRRAAHTQP